MSDIKISQLDPYPGQPSSVDYFPLVDSASVTTYRETLSALSIFPVSSSLFAISASFASASISSSYSMNYRKVYGITRLLSDTTGNSVDFFRVANDYTHNMGLEADLAIRSMMISLQIEGDISQVSKTYLLSTNYTSPGDPYGNNPHSGWYTAKPTSANTVFTNYADPLHPAFISSTDYDLELSQSLDIGSEALYFRVRTTYIDESSPRVAYGSLSIFFLSNPLWYETVTLLPYNEVSSSNSLPIWNTSFIENKDWISTIYGSLNVLNGITGSLNGTSSFSISASSVITSSYSIISSYSISSSNALTASYISASSVLTSSYSISSSNALTSSYSISSSNALTSNYAVNADYATTANYVLNNSIKAFGTVLMATASYPAGYNTVMISSASYNIESVVYAGANRPVDPNDTWTAGQNNGQNPYGIKLLHTVLPDFGFIVNFINPMPTRYYTVLWTYIGYEPYGYESIVVYYSPAGQTINGFTMSFHGGDNSSQEAKFITNFMVLHP
jgi:hypothetical protein